MARALSLLQPLTNLVTIAAPPAPAGSAQAGPAAPSVSRSSQQVAAAAVAVGPEAAAAVAAAAAAAAAAAVPTTSGYGAPSATTLAALLLHPETRGDRGGAFDAARSFYALLIAPADSVLAALNDRPGRFLYAEWMALLQVCWGMPAAFACAPKTDLWKTYWDERASIWLCCHTSMYLTACAPVHGTPSY